MISSKTRASSPNSSGVNADPSRKLLIGIALTAGAREKPSVPIPWRPLGNMHRAAYNCVKQRQQLLGMCRLFRELGFPDRLGPLKPTRRGRKSWILTSYAKAKTKPPQETPR